jgi:hypothetical protein
MMTMTVHVSPTTRTLTLTLTPVQAQALMENFDQTREPNEEGKQLYGALVAIRNGTNYGASF